MMMMMMGANKASDLAIVYWLNQGCLPALLVLFGFISDNQCTEPSHHAYSGTMRFHDLRRNDGRVEQHQQYQDWAARR